MNWPLLQNSLLVALITTALAVCFGLATALWLATLRSPWRNLFLAFAVAALALPPFLVTNSWLDLLGDNGALRSMLPLKIYSLSGTVWILSLMLWPITLIAVLSAWRRLEPEQFECEPAMTGFSLLRFLLLPAARGELAIASVVMFVLALNNFAVPAILQTKVLPDEMWIRFNTQFDTFGALRLALPLVIAPMLLLAWMARSKISWPRVRGGVSPEIFRRQLGSSWRILCGIFACGLCAFSVALPLAQIVTAKRTWSELPGAIEASADTIWNSFWFAALAATVVVGLGIILHRRNAETQRGEASQSRLASAATWASWLMFFVPGVLIGIALIKIFNRPVLFAFYQSVGIVLLALIIRYFALALTATRHAVASTDADLSDVAAIEGATRWQLFRDVTWPQIAPQMCAAWYVVYLLCLWDVESIVLIQPPGGETLALKIFNLLHYGHATQVNALCVALLGLAVLPLIAGAAFVRMQKFCSSNSSRGNCALMSAATVFLFTTLTGCSPSNPQREAALNSKLFEDAIIIGHRGVGIGEFNKTRSVAVDLNDNVYAVDMTGRVQKFSPEGEFLFSWQMPQTDLGKPKGMGRDRDGNIIVVEPHYQRINHFTPDGKLVAQWGCKSTNEGCFLLPRGIAENSHGEFLVCEYMGAERVQRFSLVQSPESKVQSQKNNSIRNQSSATNWPYQKLDEPLESQTAHDVAAHTEAKLLQVIGHAGTGPGEFNRAEGICVDSQDRIYVADSCNHRIQIFSPDGKFLREFGKPGSALGEFSYPYDVAVDRAGNIFVCEFGNSRIQVFDANCEPIEIIGGAGVEPGQFNNPWSIALDSQGNLYVADALNHRLQKLVRKKSVASGQWSVAKDLPMVVAAGYGLRTTD